MCFSPSLMAKTKGTFFCFERWKKLRNLRNGRDEEWSNGNFSILFKQIQKYCVRLLFREERTTITQNELSLFPNLGYSFYVYPIWLALKSDYIAHRYTPTLKTTFYFEKKMLTSKLINNRSCQRLSYCETVLI